MAAPDGFAIDVDTNAEPTVVTVCGELDMSTAPSLAEVLTRDAPSGATVTVDLAAVSFIDSTAIGALVSAAQTLNDGGGRLQIGPRSDAVARVLEITGLAAGSDVFDVLER